VSNTPLHHAFISNDPLNPDILRTHDRLVFGVSGRKVAEALYRNLKLKITAKGVSDLAREYMEIFLEDYVPGEELKVGKDTIVVLGPERKFAHAVELHASGNPDHDQYADIGRRKIVRVVEIEEAVKVCRDYQAHHRMGGGNCGEYHGRVWEIIGEKRREVGRISYNGTYRTIDEIVAKVAAWKIKYAKA